MTLMVLLIIFSSNLSLNVLQVNKDIFLLDENAALIQPTTSANKRKLPHSGKKKNYSGFGSERIML